MKMILSIAWRNIWRNKTRSWVVIGSILVGIWSILFMLSFSYGLITTYVDNTIRYQSSHIQIHNPDWKEDQEVEFTLENTESVLQYINNQSYQSSATQRTLVNGMVRSSRGARGAMIKGIHSEKEGQVSHIDQKIVEGKYFTENKKNEIIIAQKLAERLKLKIRKKLVLQFQNAQGDIVAGSFRIVGLFSTANTLYDESFVMIKQTDLNRLLVLPNASHEIAVFLDNSKELAQVKSDIQNQFPHLLIEDYKEISPDANLYESQMEVSHRIFITIFMLALIFGIINTMLMAVLERNKELGMLMALGMNKTRVFFMIVFETLMLGIIALPFGLILSWLSITYFGKHGVDLSAFSDGMEQFGMSTLIKSYIPTELYFSLSIATVFTALLASIYPAIKAINLKPIEAMRKI